jgi:hypothetical protein
VCGESDNPVFLIGHHRKWAETIAKSKAFGRYLPAKVADRVFIQGVIADD